MPPACTRAVRRSPFSGIGGFPGPAPRTLFVRSSGNGPPRSRFMLIDWLRWLPHGARANGFIPAHCALVGRNQVTRSQVGKEGVLHIQFGAAVLVTAERCLIVMI